MRFFHLSSPDLLFGFDDKVRHRNIVGLIRDHPDIANQGVMLRKYGQEVIRVTAGKRIHGTGAIPGGVNKSLGRDERNYLLQDIAQIVSWSQDAVALIKRIFLEQIDCHMEFATICSNMLSIVAPDGGFDIYHGGLRARDVSGKTIFDHIDYTDYTKLLREEVKSWSFMKSPYIESIGSKQGWYRVGPLARLNNCAFIFTPLAEQERQAFATIGNGKPIQATLAYHWARLIELLHCAEAIRELLYDPDLLGTELLLRGELQNHGVGVIEAPRGTLFHHYEINIDGLVEKANLIVATTNNNQAMNESIRQVASCYLDGRKLTEPLLNQIEVAIRAYDPCLSCATHALGKMPLEVELVCENNEVVDQMVRSSQGNICHTANTDLVAKAYCSRLFNYQ